MDAQIIKMNQEFGLVTIGRKAVDEYLRNYREMIQEMIENIDK